MSRTPRDPRDSNRSGTAPNGAPGAARRPISLEDEYEERMTRPRGVGAPPRAPRGGQSGFPGGCVGLVGIALVLFLFGPILLEMSVDWQWFGSLGLQGVFGTRLGAGFGVFGAGVLAAAIFLAVNWTVARRIAMPRVLFPGQQLLTPPGVVRFGITAGTIVLALVFGLIAAGAWSTVLAFSNHTAFGVADPIFNQDSSFYVFELPFYEFLRGWGLGLLVMTAIGAAVIYATRPGLIGSGGRFDPDRRMVAHFTVLAVAFLLLTALGSWFARYDLLFSEHPVFYGASYTDVHARLLALEILTVITGAIALLLLVNLRLRTLVPIGIAAGVWILAQVVIGGLYPGAVQNFVVKPAESDKEKPYITNNITASRYAFGLDRFTEHRAEATTRLTRADVESNRPLVDS
ncbi:MAG TPA: UPF0182 family protein, partial [Chloroflexia bacterium]|nr:UPF0182 family protein [Chloroflexia bacterium]